MANFSNKQIKRKRPKIHTQNKSYEIEREILLTPQVEEANGGIEIIEKVEEVVEETAVTEQAVEEIEEAIEEPVQDQPEEIEEEVVEEVAETVEEPIEEIEEVTEEDEDLMEVPLEMSEDEEATALMEEGSLDGEEDEIERLANETEEVEETIEEVEETTEEIAEEETEEITEEATEETFEETVEEVAETSEVEEETAVEVEETVEEVTETAEEPIEETEQGTEEEKAEEPIEEIAEKVEESVEATDEIAATETAEAVEEEDEEEVVEEKPKKDEFTLTAPQDLDDILATICTKRARKLIYRPADVIFSHTTTVLGTDKTNDEKIKIKAILDAEIKQGVKLGYLDKFDGLKMSELKEEYENDIVYEYADQEFKRTGIRLDGDKVKVYVYDWDMKACHHVGYIDDESAELVKPYIIDREKYSFDINGIIVGGKFKKIIKDEKTGKITVEKGNDGNLGMEIDINIINRKD